MKRDEVGIICVRALLLSATMDLTAVAADPTAAAGVARIELPPGGRVSLAMPFDAATSGCPSTVTLLGWDGPGQCYADRDGNWTPRAGEGFFALNRGTATVQAAWAGRLPDDAREIPFWTQLTLTGQPVPAGASNNGWRHPVGGTVTDLTPGVGYWHSAASNGTWLIPGPNGRSQLDLAAQPPCAADDPVVVRVAGAPGDTIRLQAQNVLADANGVGAVGPWTQVSAGILSEDGLWTFADRTAPIGTDGATAVRLYAAEKSVPDATVTPGSGTMRTTCVTGSFARVRIRVSHDGVAPTRGRLALYVHADPLLSGPPALSLTKALPSRWPTDWMSSDRRLAVLPARTWWIVHLDANANGLIDADEVAAFATLSAVSGGEAQFEATLSLSFPFRNGTTVAAVEEPMTLAAQRSAASAPPSGGGGSCLWTVVGDYDGDGYDNQAVVRKADYVWAIWSTNGGSTNLSAFGYAGCLPVPGDYDGDGKVDKAVVSTSTWRWHIARSLAGYTERDFGFSGCTPVPADYDGDGTTDVAVVDSAFTWYIQRSRDGFMTYAFGYGGCVPVPADYDGDGKADIAVLDMATYNWFLMRSRDGFKTEVFGYAPTEPRPGDYDGDGKADLCVVNRADGWWHLRYSISAPGTDSLRILTPSGIPAPGRFESRHFLSLRNAVENCPSTATWTAPIRPIVNGDLDFDGLEDAFEIKLLQAGVAATIQQIDPQADPDGDGLTNLDESAFPACDPSRRDTDGDGLTDREEVLRYRTDPARADTDGDGTPDAVDTPSCGMAVATFEIEQNSAPNRIYVVNDLNILTVGTRIQGFLSTMGYCSEQQFQTGLGAADTTYEPDPTHHESGTETYVTLWRSAANAVRLHIDNHTASSGGQQHRIGSIRFNRARIGQANVVAQSGSATTVTADRRTGTVSWKVVPDQAGNGGYGDIEIFFAPVVDQPRYFSRDTFYVPWQNSGSTNLSGPRFRLSCAPTNGLTWSVSGLAGVTIDPNTGILSFGANTQPGIGTLRVAGIGFTDEVRLAIVKLTMPDSVTVGSGNYATWRTGDVGLYPFTCSIEPQGLPDTPRWTIEGFPVSSASQVWWEPGEPLPYGGEVVNEGVGFSPTLHGAYDLPSPVFDDYMPPDDRWFGLKVVTVSIGQSLSLNGALYLFFQNIKDGMRMSIADGKRIPPWYYYWSQGVVEHLSDFEFSEELDDGVAADHRFIDGQDVYRIGVDAYGSVSRPVYDTAARTYGESTYAGTEGAGCNAVQKLVDHERMHALLRHETRAIADGGLGHADSDHDGLSNARELEIGTDPNLEDTCHLADFTAGGDNYSGYRSYADQELYCRIKQAGVKVMHPERDFAMPGLNAPVLP